MSPKLRERYAALGRWLYATHGHWLALSDMEELWGEPKTPLLIDVNEQVQAGRDDWPNEASALFQPSRLSLFAASDLSYEKIYLLWLDCAEEPELWVYDANGESRYPDLRAYLEAYLREDISAAQNSWRA